MKYTVELLKDTKTKTGKPMYHCNLTDEKGSVEAINLFEKVENGQVIEGEIYANDKGFRNFKSSASVAKSNFVDNKKTEQIEKVMEKKADSIQRFQDEKQASIVISSTFRDATQITLAEMEYFNRNGKDFDAVFQERWIYWRQWLIKNFDSNEARLGF